MALNSMNLTEIKLEDTIYKFDGEGPRLTGIEHISSINTSVDVCYDDKYAYIDVTIENLSAKDCEAKRITLYTGVDCMMETFPEWNDKLFPTLMRCEKTHFFGYFMSPAGDILGIACCDPIASYKLYYKNKGKGIFSVGLDLINEVKQPERFPNDLKVLRARTKMKRRFVLFKVDKLENFERCVNEAAGLPMIMMDKYTIELGEKIKINGFGIEDELVEIISPSGMKLNNASVATEYGLYKIKVSSDDKIINSCVYCRKDWAYYLKQARSEALRCPQKATTHCESWYGLFSGYLAAKHYPEKDVDELVEQKFSEIMPYMFDFEKGEPKVIPERIQNVSSVISLLVDRYFSNPEKYYSSLEIADRLSNFLADRQGEDGAFYCENTHYTCVIYIAKSIFELYLAEKDIPRLKEKADKHYKMVQCAIDDLVRRLDDIETEGAMTFEDGMISCSALQIAMFALYQEGEEREKYTKAAEYMLRKHLCVEQKRIPDCRMRNCSIRYWEAQFDILVYKKAYDSPHGWSAWTLYAKYYLYILTGKFEYLADLMDGMGSCVQLIDVDGVLRWGFMCDPGLETRIWVKDKKISNGYSGKFEDAVIGEQYMPMISDWFRQDKQIPTGGYLHCPLTLKNEVKKVDIQGGCCDNDVHEIFKCLEETVLKKVFVHRKANGEIVSYGCCVKDGEIKLLNHAEKIILYSDFEETFVYNKEKIKTIPHSTIEYMIR